MASGRQQHGDQAKSRLDLRSGRGVALSSASLLGEFERVKMKKIATEGATWRSDPPPSRKVSRSSCRGDTEATHSEPLLNDRGLTLHERLLHRVAVALLQSIDHSTFVSL